MSGRQQIHVHVDRVVSDQPLDEATLQAAIAERLSARLANVSGHGGSASTVQRTGREVADRVIDGLPAAAHPIGPRMR